MDDEPKLESKAIDPALVRQTVHDCLQVSSEYGFDCLDLEDDLVQEILDWYDAQVDQLQNDFQAQYPQAGAAQQRLIAVMRKIVPLKRIHVEGVGLEFRRTQVLTHWAEMIYYDCIRKLFVKLL